VLEEFNIEKSAGGPGKAVTRNFTAYVTNHTLEIRFYWAGRGTNGIPERGVYGPLISAISVTPSMFFNYFLLIPIRTKVALKLIWPST
jgi:Malectin domain